MKNSIKVSLRALVLVSALAAQVSIVFAQSTAFTFQGRLTDGTANASGLFDLEFTVFAVDSGGASVAGPLTTNAVPVASGLFAVTLDFGPGLFTGPGRWLELGVRTNGGSSFTTLSPRT